MKHNPGIGATQELSLRVSVATLVRVIFKHPVNDEWMLALERRATLLQGENGHFVAIKAQPFGGALRLLNTNALEERIGDFHFDSEQSRSEQDFRVFIRPSAWETILQFCLQHFRQIDDPVLEYEPTRELSEEFADTLQIDLRPDQYSCKPVGMIVENTPSPTENVYTRGSLTARLYRIFEARILDPSLALAMLTNSASETNQHVERRAFADFRNGGPGWYNAVLTLPLKLISARYSAISPRARNQPISFQNHQLDETVAAVLENITVPKYQKL